MNQRIAPLVDVMIGNEEDFTASLGYDVEDVRLDLAGLDIVGFGEMIERVTSDLPNLAVVTTTLRGVRSSRWLRQFRFWLIYGLLHGLDLPDALEYGAAHGALAMTTPGDTSMATTKEVESLVRGGSARVQR